MRARDRVTNTELDPDWSCYEVKREQGRAAGTRTASFELLFLIPALLDGVTVDYFFGSSTLGAPAATRVFDTSGAVTLELPDGVATLSVHVHGRARDDRQSVAETREYDLPIPPGSEAIEGYLLLQDQFALITNLALGGESPDLTKAVLTSVVRDCQGRDVSGGVFELIDGQTGKPIETGTDFGAPHSSYFQNALPTTNCTFTSNEQAGWVMVNAPVNVDDQGQSRRLRLRLKGRMRARDARPVMIAERDVELFAGTMSLVRVTKLHQR